jgi:hypothetical protein
MKFDSKVKGGLAWAGLFVILAVPSADLLFGNDKAPAANLAVTSDAAPARPVLVVPAATTELRTDPVETASVAAPAAKSDDPIDTYLQKGKKLPSYISDADSAPAVKPAIPAAVTVKPPVEVAAVNPATETPPVPLPRDARPKATAPVVASVPAAKPATPATQPLIIDETELAQREAALTQPKRPVEPFPLSDGGSDDDVVVTGDQLEEWDSGSLAEYLERKGLLSGQAAAEDDSDFVFNEGPSRPRRPLNDFFLF